MATNSQYITLNYAQTILERSVLSNNTLSRSWIASPRFTANNERWQVCNISD